ncbi:hypothetical protein BDV93DRAFT_550119 [Ceratobasidium sp. AG-I]|nr:hypothetical protein BDV93DRAFT_550119 [Ceratobasidium sp. AG-I]
MSKKSSLPRASIQRKHLTIASAFVSTSALFYLSSLSSLPISWHKVPEFFPSEPNAVSSLGLSHPGAPANLPIPDIPKHQLVEGGRLKVVLGGTHPLYDLIADAEAKWNDMSESQSTTLDAAVEEYQRRYGRRPPRGFEKWYHFARSVNFKLIDEFDQIDRDITPFLALPHQVMQERAKSVSQDNHSYHLVLANGNATIGGPLAHWEVAPAFQSLISDFAKDLPDMKFYISGHDGGPTILTEDMRLAVNAVLEKGERLTERQIAKIEDVQRNPRRGVANACLQDPATFYPSALPERNQHTHTFIHNHRASMSFCTNPTILNNPLKRHGYFAYDMPHQRSASPLFVQSQLSAGGAVLHPALQSYVSPIEYTRRFGPLTPWKNRTSKIFWRGRTTGEWLSQAHDWRYSHRVRLHVLANRDANRTDPSVDPLVNLLIDGENGQGVYVKQYPRDLLNDKYMDVGLIGPPVQCDDSEQDHTCQTMDATLKWAKEVGWEFGLNSKYLLDVDGNGWSSRFQRLLASGAVVFKMTIFPEWNSDWLIPYYHYVPIQTDYSDLYDSLAFFMGAPGGPAGHDELAEKIGMHSHEFATQHWRREDMQVYVYRLLLEYARAISEDREAMTMAL